MFYRSAWSTHICCCFLFALEHFVLRSPAPKTPCCETRAVSVSDDGDGWIPPFWRHGVGGKEEEEEETIVTGNSPRQRLGDAMINASDDIEHKTD